jgi:hypothetical protein
LLAGLAREFKLIVSGAASCLPANGFIRTDPAGFFEVVCAIIVRSFARLSRRGKVSDTVVAENKPADIGQTEPVWRRALGLFSGKSEHWWIAVCTAMLTVSTVVLFIATFALVHSTNQLAKQEKEHGEEEWRRVVHATVGELSNATNASPARRVCARYVVAVDVANGVTAEDAGRVAHARAAPKAFGNFPLSRIEMATGVTNSLLEAVVGSTPIVDSYNLVSSNVQLTPLAKACLTSLFSVDNFGSILAKEKGAIVSRLHQELMGYQNAVERAAELATANPPIPESARDALADNLEGAFAR